jgi:DNA-binding NtrC family response regulator
MGSAAETGLIMCDPPTVLIVDDEVSFREIIKMALEAWGYGVRVAGDGEEALSITRTIGPNIVLSDVVMPKLDGLTLLRRLKRWNPEIAVILFTAHPNLTDAVSAMKMGAEDVLTKPIDFNRLRLELERILGTRSNGSSSAGSPANSGSALRKPPPPKRARFAPAD